ncbi:MAG: cytochrome c oxidase subunit II [Planctomycetota bacterium]
MNLTHLGQQALLAVQDAPKGKTFFFPEQASTVAGDIDSLFYLIYWVSVVSFVLVIGATAFFAWHYREREGKRAIKTSTHDNTLEMTWTIIPTILVAVMFWIGFKGFLDLKRAPENSYEIQVTGYQWDWTFTYPNGFKSRELHVPANQPVRLVMSSIDVIHSLFIPAFRVKQDVVPGRYSSLWFEATPGAEALGETGFVEYDLFCTEYCGSQHSSMITKCVVHEDMTAYEAWLEQASNFIKDLPPVEAGEATYNAKGCTQCHLATEERKIGPGFLTLSKAIRDGQAIEFSDGSSVVPDENYIRESLLYPEAKKRVDYADQNMASYLGRLEEYHITGLIAWIKSLAENQ